MTIDFSKISKEKIQKLIDINPDSRRYFFTRADESWLIWLWENGFLDAIKEKGLNLDRYGYVTPELDYLVRMAEKKPKEVVDIMLSIPINSDTFNPEVADRFLWICGILPADQLSRIIIKIKEEQWTVLMRRYGHSGYEYKRMIEKLNEAKDFKTILILAEVLLAIRTKEDIQKTANGFGSDNPFYLSDIDQTDIFKSLVNVDEKYNEQTLSIVSSVMKEIVLLGKDQEEEELFEVGELFYLFEVDFFSLSVDDKKHFSYRDDVRNFVATLKELIEKTLGKKCDNEAEAKRIFKTYVNSLPFSRSMWRLRLFSVSLCPETFKETIKDYLFRIFDDKAWSSLLSGAEYEWLLKKTFFTLSEEDKKLYISNVFSFFGDTKKESFFKQHGYELLSCIDSFLTGEQRKRSETIFTKKPNPEYVPEPTIKESMAGTIQAQAPIDQTTLNGMKVVDIASKLSIEWSPENIVKKDTTHDFYRPINAEGMGAEIQKNISSRFEEYIQNASLFFNRNELHPQYTYSYLQGVYDVIRQDSFKKETADIENILILFKAIVNSGREEPFDTKKTQATSRDGWLANWSWIHNTMTDVLKDIIGENKTAPLVDFTKHKEFLLDTISYLLTYPSPTIEDNARENGGDPFTTAINSVRGRAFQALSIFVYQDGLLFPKEDESKISKEVKDIYENLLRAEDTYAIMFMFGHYLPTYYYRDKVWVRSLLPEIFPYETKKDLYVASWEGYLSTSLYREMFDELKSYYAKAIEINPNQTERRYFKDTEEGLATHIALAFMHFADITFESEIFKLFWTTPNIDQHTEFVSFIGRYSISIENGAGFRETNKIDIEKLKQFWDWILVNCKEPETFSGFGFWMKDDSNSFDIKWLTEHIYKTLEKSEGKINWEYGLMMSLSKLATESPENTLKILQAYLVGPRIAENINHVSIYIESEIFNTFKILYSNPLTKIGTGALINKLLPLSSGRFWKLEEITRQEKNKQE